MLGAFANGVAISFLPLFLLPVLGNVGLANATFSDADYGVFGLILGGLSAAGGQVAIIVGLIASVAVLYVLTFVLRARDKALAAATNTPEAREVEADLTDEAGRAATPPAVTPRH